MWLTPQKLKEPELEVALDYGKIHVERVFQALEAGDIQCITPTETERKLMPALPHKLHAGEREAIIICQTQKLPFLSNDRRAVNYCDKNGIRAIPLVVVADAFALDGKDSLQTRSQRAYRDDGKS